MTSRFALILSVAFAGSFVWAAQPPGGEGMISMDGQLVREELQKMRKNFDKVGNAGTGASSKSDSLPNVESLVKTGPSAIPETLNCLRDKKTPWEMRALLAEEVLRRIPDQRALSPLGEIIRDKTEKARLRRAAVAAIGKIGGKEALQAIVSVADDEPDNQPMQVSVVSALGAVGDKEGSPILRKRLTHRDPYIRIAAAQALLAVATKSHDDSISAPLVELLDNKSLEKRHVLIGLVGDSNHREAIPVLARVLQDTKETHVVRWAAVRALGKFGGDDAVNALVLVFEDKDELVRAEAIEAAVNAGLKADKVPMLEHAFQLSKDEYTRGMIRKAINRVRSK